MYIPLTNRDLTFLYNVVTMLLCVYIFNYHIVWGRSTGTPLLPCNINNNYKEIQRK